MKNIPQTIRVTRTIMTLSGRSGGNKFKLYGYDDFNRLIRYNDGATEAKYTYSANNLRASKTVNGTKTNFVWNGQNLASETKNDVTAVYTYDMTGVITSKTDNDSVTRYVKDPHGNVIATSKNNSLFGEYDYTAFGIQIKNTDASNPFRYCGEYYDEELDSVYLRNRYYTPSTGRFLTEDPIKDRLNWYVYCGNNPVILFDPSGLAPGDVFETLDLAAIDAGNYLLALTFDNDQEMCAIFYPVEGGFTYYEAENTAENKLLAFEISWDLDDNPLAYIHTHVFYDVDNFNDIFSNPENTAVPGSGGDTGGSDNCGLPVYLATPYGNLRKYTPNSGNWDGDLISSDLVVDPKYTAYQQIRNTLIWRLLDFKYPSMDKMDIIRARVKHPNSIYYMLEELKIIN